MTDSIGYSAASDFRQGYPQPHGVVGAPGRSLCLFDKRSRKAESVAAPADGMK